MEREQQKINWNGIELHLTRREYDFLYLLASSPKRIYTFEQIYQLVWKDYPVGDIKNIIWCLVKRLRKKLNAVEDGIGERKGVRTSTNAKDWFIQRILL